MPARQARELGLVVLERTVRELQGEPCIPLDEAPAPRKGMAVTRSAGAPMRDQDKVMGALAAHATRAASAPVGVVWGWGQDRIIGLSLNI